MNCVHKRYQAKRRPRVLCNECWFVWFQSGNAKVEDLEVFRRMMCEKTLEVVAGSLIFSDSDELANITQ
jgi:hypothetical protein